MVAKFSSLARFVPKINNTKCKNFHFIEILGIEKIDKYFFNSSENEKSAVFTGRPQPKVKRITTTFEK
jgi:hypothetical protein